VFSLFIALPAFGEARTKLQLFEEQLRLMNQSGYVADLERPRSKKELNVIANGKRQLHDEMQKTVELLKMQYDAGQISEVDVAQFETILSQTNLERELFEQRAKVAAPAEQLKSATANLDTIELVRTSLVRFGGVGIILFLISLLTPIYRYNVRLGTFFQARRIRFY